LGRVAERRAEHVSYTGSALEELSAAPADSGGRTKPDSEVISFADVVRAHYEWDAALRKPDEGKAQNARVEFITKLAEFERHFKCTLVEAYWCRREASAVALVLARQPRLDPLRRLVQRFLRRQEAPDFRLYRVTDWVTGDVQKLADLLHECDVLAIKATWGLEGFQRAVVMQWLLAVEVRVLGFIESGWKQASGSAKAPGEVARGASSATDAVNTSSAAAGKSEQDEKRALRETAARLDGFYRRTQRELSKIEDYYQQAGEKRARLRYVEGMLLFGMLAVALMAVVSGLILEIFGLLDFDSAGVRRFYACMAAGAIGAVVSVLMRMSGRGGGFTIDHELGSVGVMRLGSFRPPIGAVSGVVLSFLVQTTLVPVDEASLSIEFYVVVAFLAGFSERWTKVVLGSAMRTIDQSDAAPEGDRRSKASTDADPA